ncbi:MAG: FKBP-type peptidyl-prolyl cis-trans isomerase [Agarilytica sp.]
MNKNIIICGFASLALFGCGEEQTASVPNIDVQVVTLEQKVSYIIGYDNAERLQDEGFVLDADAVYKAVVDVNAGRESVLPREDIAAVMMTFQTQLQEKHQNEHQQVAGDNKRKGQQFLQANAERKGVVTRPSGLQYEILKAGEGLSPNPTDNVTVNYTGKFIDGEVFDVGQEVSFQVDQLIPAWVEVLPLMKEGGKWVIFVPPALAYGEGGTGSIGPNSTLMFEMELLSVFSGEK